MYFSVLFCVKILWTEPVFSVLWDINIHLNACLVRKIQLWNCGFLTKLCSKMQNIICLQYEILCSKEGYFVLWRGKVHSIRPHAGFETCSLSWELRTWTQPRLIFLVLTPDKPRRKMVVGSESVKETPTNFCKDPPSPPLAKLAKLLCKLGPPSVSQEN